MSFTDWVDVPGDADFARVVVLSPHFDDAVMGAGQMMAAHPGTVVVTVFGGRPPAYPEPPSDWDRLGGFESGDDVVALRRDEDRAALAVLGAVPHWLDLADHQYVDREHTYGVDDVAAAIAPALDELTPTAVFFPFGLGNPDHDLTHRAARSILEHRDDVAWFCYEDAGYVHLPGLLAWRIRALFQAGWWPTPAIVALDPDLERKNQALRCYRSQLPPLRRDHLLDERIAAAVAEQHWRIARPPAGWEAMVDLPG